jgi:hypothetical protein
VLISSLRTAGEERAGVGTSGEVIHRIVSQADLFWVDRKLS